MRITYLLTWGDTVGGTERAVLTQAAWLRHHHEVTVLGTFRTSRADPFAVPPGVARADLIDISDGPPRLTDDAHGLLGATSRTIDATALAALPSSLVDPAWESAFNGLTDEVLRRTLPRLDADVVVTTSPALLAIAARLLPDSVALVHQEHRTSELRTTTLPPLLAFGPAADLVVFLTDITADWFRSTWGPTTPTIAVVGNAVAPDSRPRSALADDTIVMAARLVGAKQPGHAVSAFAKVAERFPTWTLRLIGDGPLAARVRAQVREAGLSDRVLLLGQTRFMPLQWASASIGVLTSRAEGFPLVIPEAFAAGVPFVAYACPHGPEHVIRHGHDGLLVPPDDIDALAAAIAELMGDPGRLRRMGETAYGSADAFSVAAVGARWDRLLRDAAAAPGRIPRAERIEPLRPGEATG